jgi:SnoaL-like domain
METIDDGRGSAGICHPVCRRLGGARRQCLYGYLASRRLAGHAAGEHRRVKGSELGRLMEVQTSAAPDFVWQLLDWTSRGDVIIIEWQTTRNVNGIRFEWRGVDKFRIRQGKIIEERVYSDTAPLRAFRKGETLEPITTL